MRSDSFPRALMARLRRANRGLFMLGVSTAGRISELLSLTIGDVYQNRTAVTDLLYDPVNSQRQNNILSCLTCYSRIKIVSLLDFSCKSW